MAPQSRVSSRDCWIDFLEKVEDPPPDAVLVQKVADWFANDLHFESPGKALGFDQSRAAIPLRNESAEALVKKVVALIDKRAQLHAKAQRKSLAHKERLREELEIGSYQHVLCPHSATALKHRARNTRRKPQEKSAFDKQVCEAMKLDNEKKRPQDAEEIERLRDENTSLKAELERLQAQVAKDNVKAVGQASGTEPDGHIFILNHDGSEFFISFRPAENLAQLKQRLAEIVLVPIEQLGVAYGSSILGDNSIRLDDCNVKNGSRLSLFVEEPPQKPDFKDEASTLGEDCDGSEVEDADNIIMAH